MIDTTEQSSPLKPGKVVKSQHSEHLLKVD